MVIFYSWSCSNAIGKVCEDFIPTDSWNKAEVHVFMESGMGGNRRGLGPEA